MHKLIFLLCFLCFSTLVHADPFWVGEATPAKQCPGTLDATVLLASGWHVTEDSEVGTGAQASLTYRLLSDSVRRPACYYSSGVILKSDSNLCEGDGIIVISSPEASEHVCVYPARGIQLTSKDVDGDDWKNVTLTQMHEFANALCTARNFLTYTAGDSDAYASFTVAEDGVMTAKIKCSSTRKSAPATSAAIRSFYQSYL